MTTILRNLLSILRRFKIATLLNILGLSVAFAAFIIIMAQIDYDRSFDKFHPDYDKIFRVEITNASATQAIINRPLSELLFASSPHILSGTITNAFGNNLFFSVDNNGTQHSYEEDMLIVSPSYTDVFTFDMVEGTADALKNPSNVLIPLSLSQKLFGNQSAIGKMLLGRGGSLTVGGVYHDFPKNSLVKNYMFFPLPENLKKNNWNNWNYHAYIRVDDAANVPFLFDNFKQNFDPSVLSNGGEGFPWEKAGMDIGFTALPDVHYVTDVLYDSTPKASKQTLIVLFAIAIIIVLIAGINFTNFSTALTPMRIKSINTQKVLGGDQKTIRTSLVLEAIVISLVSYLIGLGIIALFNKTSLTALVDADPSFSAQPVISIGTALLALFTGLLAGLYPAYYMTSFPPALVLKGSFGLSPKGRKMRNTLISVQFIASFALIIGTGFMYLQNYYMQHTPLGYDKDELIVTNVNSKINESREAFSSQLKTFAGVEDVTYAESLLSSSDQYMGWGRDYKGEQIQYQCLPVDHSFLKVMNIEIVEGRDFRREDANTKAGAYIFNEKAHEMYNLELGSMIDSTEIVGFMPDVKFASFRTEVVPMAFYLRGTRNWESAPDYAYIKVKSGSDMRSAMTHVRATLTQFDAEYPFNVRFFDNVLQQLYEKENSLSSLITLFSIIAIFISIVGVFGLVVFDSEYRRKEIGVRKVLGSTTQQILILFNKTYIRILCLCFVLAAPLAYYMVVSWLENFAYKTPLYWWVFLAAFAIVAIITIATVTFQNYWTANENPVNSIKTE